MESIPINSFKDLMDCLDRNIHSSAWIYRGQSKEEWKLIPKIFRENYSWANDKVVIEAWKRRSSIFINRSLTSWWDWLTLAQHHGVPTRLLDWTFTPLVAAFFASIDNLDSDGVIYAYKYRRYIIPEKNDPFDGNTIDVFRPNSITERVFNQDSIFTIHSKKTPELDDSSKEGELLKWIISKEYKLDLLNKLNQLGINYSTIFPDLDGLAKYISWRLDISNISIRDVDKDIDKI